MWQKHCYVLTKSHFLFLLITQPYNISALPLQLGEDMRLSSGQWTVSGHDVLFSLNCWLDAEGPVKNSDDLEDSRATMEGAWVPE